VIDREADLEPAAEGLNVTVIVWLCPAAIVAVVGDTLNCEPSVPVTVMPDIVNAALPVLEIVNVAVPETPTFTLPAEREVVDSEMAGVESEA
jgi:hypothetical protein